MKTTAEQLQYIATLTTQAMHSLRKNEVLLAQYRSLAAEARSIIADPDADDYFSDAHAVGVLESLATLENQA